MRRHLALALIVPGFAAVFAVAIGAGYFMGQTSFRRSLPPPGLTVPSIPTPGASAPSDSDSGPAGAEASTSPSSPAQQPVDAEAPQGPGPASQVMPSAPTGPAGVQRQPASSPSQNPTSAGTGPTALPAIPGPPSRFHVQAGNFGDRDNAAALVKQLRDRGYAVTLVEGPPYRVWVGGYLDRATAERLAANLQAAGYDASLTPR